MNAIKTLFTNEHSFAMVILIIGATVLAAMDRMTTDQWTSFAQWIFGIYMGGHAVISVGGQLSASKTGTNPSTPTPGAGA